MLTLSPNTILQIHQGMHQEVAHEPTTETLKGICADVHQRFAKVNTDINSVFIVAAAYATLLTHHQWSAQPNRSTETAFAVCLMYLNHHGLRVDGTSQALFDSLRETWVTAEDFALTLMYLYSRDIAASEHHGAGALPPMTIMRQGLISRPRPFRIAELLEQVRASFTVSACVDHQF